ncbi:hypothetical protein B0H11DRAFT_2240649 [Mycena galericulata]|nr:hypothetical protein B0H11DRAFT_2240649 [Mycena galericulata]
MKCPAAVLFLPAVAANFAHRCFRAHRRRALGQPQAGAATLAAYQQQQSDEAPRHFFLLPAAAPDFAPPQLSRPAANVAAQADPHLVPSPPPPPDLRPPHDTFGFQQYIK